MDQDTDNETLAVTMSIPLRLIHYFEPGKIVELCLPNRRGDYFRVNSSSWSDVNGETQCAIALTYQPRDTIPQGVGIPSFKVEHTRGSA